MERCLACEADAVGAAGRAFPRSRPKADLSEPGRKRHIEQFRLKTQQQPSRGRGRGRETMFRTIRHGYRLFTFRETICPSNRSNGTGTRFRSRAFTNSWA